MTFKDELLKDPQVCREYRKLYLKYLVIRLWLRLKYLVRGRNESSSPRKTTQKIDKAP